MLPLQSAFTPVYTASGYSAYLGATTITRWPLAAKAAGRAPQTSPRPPVLDQGATSEETKTTSWSTVGLVLEAPRPLLIVGRAAEAAAEEVEAAEGPAAAEATTAEVVVVVGRRVGAAAAAAEVEAAEEDDVEDEDEEGCAAANEGPLLARRKGRAGVGCVSCGERRRRGGRRGGGEVEKERGKRDTSSQAKKGAGVRSHARLALSVSS